MHRIDGYGHADNSFTEGDPATGIPATRVTEGWLNAIQEELANAVEGAGLGLDKPNNAQLLTAIRALGQLSVKDRNLTAPPAEPANGDHYIVAATATGAWEGKEDQVAVWINATWVFFAPAVGWVAYVEDEAKITAFKGGTGWSAGVAI